ncbi:MAG TPA: hypothetical protein VEC14_00215 [Reyranellaceae bacterium]|nr:hypothetical protein [Reyranellaceae bacterium]
MVDTVIVEADSSPVPAVSWPAIVAGAVVAMAITLLMLALGAGLGFSVSSPWASNGTITTTKAATVSGIFMAVTAVMSSALGGYIAGRLRTRWAGTQIDEVYFRDTAHGFITWAVATVAGAAFLASAATVIGGGAASGAAPAATMAAMDAGSRDYLPGAVDRLLLPDHGALARADAPRNPAFIGAGRDLDTDQQSARRLLSLAGQPNGLRTEDRQDLVRMVVARTGLPPEEAERRVARTEAEVKAAADTARRVAMHLSFWLAASLFLGAFAASLAATEGGAIRDGRYGLTGRGASPTATRKV